MQQVISKVNKSKFILEIVGKTFVGLKFYVHEDDTLKHYAIH